MKTLTRQRNAKLKVDLFKSLNACEQARGVKITSFEFDDSKWGRSVATRTVDKRVIVATARSGPAARKYYGMFSVEAYRHNPAEEKLLHVVSRMEKVDDDDKELHTVSQPK